GRRKPMTVTAIALALASLVGGTWLLRVASEERLARETATRQGAARTSADEVRNAELSFEKGNSDEGIRQLAQVIHGFPRYPVAAQRLLSAFTYRNFPLPLFAPLRHTGPVLSASFSQDGKWVVTASADHTARIWDVHD